MNTARRGVVYTSSPSNGAGGSSSTPASSTIRGSSAQSSLMLEFKSLQEQPVEGFRVKLVDDDNLFEWEVALFGPPQTLYEGGYFKATIKFPPDYPYSPPSVKFVTKVWHPNVYENGDLCISILHPPIDDPQSGELPCERWNPTQNVRTVMLSVISLLNEPNTYSPANVDASVMYRKWKDSNGRDREYENIIRKQVAATRLDAERDNVVVPTTLEEYCIKHQGFNSKAGFDIDELTDFYDDDFGVDDFDDDVEDDEDGVNDFENNNIQGADGKNFHTHHQNGSNNNNNNNGKNTSLASIDLIDEQRMLLQSKVHDQATTNNNAAPTTNGQNRNLERGVFPEFNPEEFQKLLVTKKMGRTCLYLDQVDSTIEVAQSISNNAIVVARIQLCGRGQRDHVWTSPAGCAMVSLKLQISRSSFAGQQISFLQHCLAVAIVRALEQIHPIKLNSQHVRIKWPNDILYLKNQDDSEPLKIGGILINTTASSDDSSNLDTILSFGLNVFNSHPTTCLFDILKDDSLSVNDTTSTATASSSSSSAFQSISPHDLSIHGVVASIVNHLEHIMMNEFSIESDSEMNFENLKNFYMSRSFHSNQQFDHTKEGRIVIIGIDDDGYLQAKRLSDKKQIKLLSLE